MKSYLISGGCGFLGKYLNAFFQEKEASVINLCRNAGTRQGYISADLATQVPELSGFSFDIVIHAAGKAHTVPRTEEEKRQFFEVNVQGTRNLLTALERCRKLPSAFIFISTVSVYGVDSGTDINETHPLNATEPYGLSKIEAEKLVQQWGSEKGVKIGILRLPLIAGSNPPGNLGSMIKGIKSGRYFRIGSGSAKKSIVLAKNVAAIIPALAEKGGIYNLSDGNDPSFTELENAITKELGLPKVKTLPYFVAASAAMAGSILETVTGKRMPFSRRILGKITSNLTFSSEKAKKELGWAPEPVLHHIKEIVSWSQTS